MSDGNANSLKQRLVDKVVLCLNVYQEAEEYGIVDLVTHPLIYADTLIRLGYEPFPPIKRRTFFHSPQLVLPGVIPYAQYLNLADGFPGVFRCVWPCLARKYVSTGVFRFLRSRCPVREGPPGDGSHMSQHFAADISEFAKDQGWTLLCRMAATIASHPFQVVAVRCMGQVVGREESYKFPIQCILEIFKSEGFFGFFSGLTPRLVGDMAYISTWSILCVSLIQYLETIREQTQPELWSKLQSAVPIVTHYLASPYSHQFYNISDIMIVNGTQLSVGSLPYTPVFSGWFDCWRRLRRDKLTKTSSGLFSRLYMGPSVATSTGGLKATGDQFGPTYFPKDGQRVPYFLSDFYAPLLPLNSTATNINIGLEKVKDAVLSYGGVRASLQDM